MTPEDAADFMFLLLYAVRLKAHSDCSIRAVSYDFVRCVPSWCRKNDGRYHCNQAGLRFCGMDFNFVLVCNANAPLVRCRRQPVDCIYWSTRQVIWVTAAREPYSPYQRQSYQRFASASPSSKQPCQSSPCLFILSRTAWPNASRLKSVVWLTLLIGQ
jgi:hypothetical protein